LSAKRVVPRDRANQDVDDAVAYCLSEDAATAALNFIDEVEKAYGHISRHPGSGSTRHAHELDLPGLSFAPLTRFPSLAF
jgi:toxin ParE1/3/4